MSYVSGAIIVVLSKGDINSDSSYEAPDALFCAQNIRLSGRIDVQNRITIIGNYVQGNSTVLSARKVEVFSSIGVLLEKVKQYSDGQASGKTVEDAKEILSHVLKLDMDFVFEELKNQTILDSFLAVFKLHEPVDVDAKFNLAYIFNLIACKYVSSENLTDQTTIGLEEGYFLAKRAYEFDPEDKILKKNFIYAINYLSAAYGDGDIPGKGLEDAISLLEKGLEIKQNDEKLKYNLAQILKILAVNYTKGVIPGKGWEDALIPISKSFDLYPQDDGIRKSLAAVCCHLGVKFSHGKVEGKGFEDGYSLILRAFELSPDNPHISYELGVFYANGKVPGKGFEDGYPLVKKAFDSDPTNPHFKRDMAIISYELGYAYAKKKGIQDAFPFVKQAYEIQPENEVYKKNYLALSDALKVNN